MTGLGQPPFRFLLTRPASQGQRFAGLLEQHFPGTEIIESPLLAPLLLRPDLPDGPWDAVVFTSETGVASSLSCADRLPSLAFAVGDQTAAAARAAGFDTQSASGDADGLVRLLTRRKPGRLLHLHGAETRGEVAERLQGAGIAAVGVVTYRQEPQPLSAAAKAALRGNAAVVVPLFSPRTANLLAREAHEASAPLWLASLSPAVDAAAELGAARRVVAARPDAEAMLAALAGLCGPAAKA